MATKRQIVEINEDLCDGCGLCVPSCAEGAIRIIDGKAKLVDDKFCDGLGACLGDCPTGAIEVIERVAHEFDEKAVEEHLDKIRRQESSKERSKTMAAQNHPQAGGHFQPGGGCPSARVVNFEEPRTETAGDKQSVPSALRQWPIQLHLVPPFAPYLQGADLLVAADCVPFAYGDFHTETLKDKAVVIGCPKLDDVDFYVDKMAAILEEADIKSVTTAIMEVPCCFGLKSIVERAIAKTGKDIPVRTEVFSIRGEKTAS